MTKTFLHRILAPAMLVLAIGWPVTAQQHVVKGTSLNFKVEENASFIYHWSVANKTLGTMPVPLASKTHVSGDYTFSEAGTYEVRVFPEHADNHCFGDALTLLVKVEESPPTAIFEDLEIPYVCAANNGDDPNSKVNVKVLYSGPKPWTFKYSVDKASSQMPNGADEIYADKFEFALEIPNLTGKTHRAEILLIEAQTLSGIPVLEDLRNQSLEVDVLALPDTRFEDYTSIVQAGSVQTYVAVIQKNENYEIFVPSGTTILGKNTKQLDDNFHSLLSFDVRWGTELGDFQIKLIERNAFDCAGDTVYADIAVVKPFEISLGGDINICKGESVVLAPEISFDDTYFYLWSDGSTEPSLLVDETGVYSVTVKNNQGNEKTDEVSVTVHPLPMIDLGEDILLYDGESAVLNPGAPGIEASYEWNTGETTQSITVNEENVYSVRATTAQGCANTDEICVRRIEGHKFSVDLGEDIQVCEGNKVYLEPTVDRTFSAAPTFKWFPSESTEKGIYVDSTGKYCVEVTDPIGNTESDCVDLTINPLPVVDLGRDLTLQLGQTVILDAGNPGSFYLWSTDEITQSITVRRAGEYWVNVTTQQSCMGYDTIAVEYPDNDRFVGVPTGFSPNGDGKNDILYVRGNNIASMNLVIYNRLGQKVFQSSRQDIGWDGTYRGQKQDMDVYVYFLQATFLDGSTVQKRGNVTLLH